MATIEKFEVFRLFPRWLVVRLESSDGIVGWGEATLEGHTEAVEGSLKDLAERFVGHPCDDIEQIWQSGFRQRFYRAGPVLLSAMSGLDIALWDIKAKRFGVPIWNLLGGKLRNKIKVYGGAEGKEPEEVKRSALERKKQGHAAVKMTPTEGLGWLDSPSALDKAVEMLKAVRSVGMDLAFDFHGRVHKPMARQLAAALEPHRPLFIEEPLLPGQIEGIKQLAAQTSIPIALGERLYSRWDCKEYFESASIDIIQPDVAHAGGISETLRIARMAEAYDIAIAPHCPLGPVAFAACCQIAMVSANFVCQEMRYPLHPDKNTYDIFTYLKDPEVFKVTDGYVQAFTAPGLGIELNEELIRKTDIECRKVGPFRNPKYAAADGSIQEW